MSYSKIIQDAITRFRSPKDMIASTSEKVEIKINTQEKISMPIFNTPPSNLEFQRQEPQKMGLNHIQNKTTQSMENPNASKDDTQDTISIINCQQKPLNEEGNSENSNLFSDSELKQNSLEKTFTNKILAKTEQLDFLAIPNLNHLVKQQFDYLVLTDSNQGSEAPNRVHEIAPEIDHFNKRNRRQEYRIFGNLSRFLVSFFQSSERTKMSYEFKKEEFEILKSIFIRKYKKWIFTT